MGATAIAVAKPFSASHRKKARIQPEQISKAAKANHYLLEGHARGKVAIAVVPVSDTT